MEAKYIRKLNDVIYTALFDKDTTALLIYFSLSPLNLRDTNDTNLRDCMGELAIEALGAIEGRCADQLNSMRDVAWDKIESVVKFTADEVAIEYKATAAGQGVHLLTGNLLTTPTE